MTKPYKPPIPIERIDAMLLALCNHIYLDKVLDRAMAIEIYDALDKLRTRPRTMRANSDDLLAAAIARDMLLFWRDEITQAAAVEAAFQCLPEDSQSKLRTYHNLLPLLSRTEWGERGPSAPPKLVLEAYRRATRKGSRRR